MEYEKHEKASDADDDSIRKADPKYRLPPSSEEFPDFRESSLFENAVRETAHYLQVDHEMAAASALGVLAACCQGLVDVAFPNGYTQPTSLMLMTLADSSERKTTVDKEFSEPLRTFEKYHAQKHRLDVTRYERDLAISKRKEKHLNKELDTCIANGDETEGIERQLHSLDKEKPTPPRSHNLIYQKFTPSALTYNMYKNLPLAYLLSDEAGSLLMGPGFEDVYLFNSLWSGSETRVDRRTSESFILDDARLSVNLMLQPAIFQRFIKHKRGQQAYESGFFARFLISYPPTMRGKRKEPRERSSKNDIKKFHNRALERLESSISAWREGKSRVVLEFSQTALYSWREAYRIIQREITDGGIYAHEASHAEKLMDNISRVAALIHTFENEDFAETEIRENDLFFAFLAVRYFSRHYMDLLAQEPEIARLANSMIKTIRAHGKKQYKVSDDTGNVYIFNMSDVKQNSHPDIRETKTYLRILKFLEQLGHVKIDHNSGKHKFCETILLTGYVEPEIKNGALYYVKELPRFNEQELVEDRYLKYYKCKTP